MKHHVNRGCLFYEMLWIILWFFHDLEYYQANVVDDVMVFIYSPILNSF